jgi:NRPS condensation-like uncharacterized protein
MKSSSTNHPQFLRFLDGFEEHFWLLEKVTSRSHILAAKITGSISPEEWRTAFQKVQRQYPMLCASIGKYPGERPFFYGVASRETPIRFCSMAEDMSLERAVEEELLLSFGSGEGPLTRAAVFHRDDRCAVILASHHSALDGKSHLYILRDLLSVLAGEQLREPQPIAPRTSTLYGRSLPPYSGTATSIQDSSPSPALHAVPPIHIARHALSPDDTEKLVSVVKSEGISVHSALLVALAKAGARQNDRWRNTSIRCLTPVDVRSRLQLNGAVGMLLTLHRIVLDHSIPFWTQVKLVNNSIKTEAMHRASLAFLDLAGILVSQEHSSESHIKAIEGSEFVHDLMLTNYGVCDLPTQIGPFGIHDLFTAGIAGGLDTQKVAAMTLDDRLHTTLVSQQPIPGLLEEAIKILLYNDVA